MEVKIEKVNECERAISVSIPADKINERIAALYQKYQKTIKIDGFRKGNVPLSIIKSRYGKAIKGEAINESIRETYKEALKKENIFPISEALLKDTKFTEEEGLSFSLSFDVLPDIEIKDYKGIKVSTQSTDASEQETSSVISKLQNTKAVYTPTVGHSASADDMVIVDYEVLEEEKGIYRKNKVPNYSILLDDPRVPGEIKKALLNSMPGNRRKAKVRYPTDFEDPKLRGTSVEYDFLVHDVKTKRLPALDDEFAKGLGFESMQALEQGIKGKIKKDKEQEAKAKIEIQIINSLIENNPFTAPKSLVRAYLEPLLKDAGKKIDDKVKKNLEEIAVWRAKREILLDKIGTVEKIKLTDEELKTKLLETKECKESGYEQMIKNLKQKNIYNVVIQELRIGKILDFLRDSADVDKKNH